MRNTRLLLAALVFTATGELACGVQGSSPDSTEQPPEQLRQALIEDRHSACEGALEAYAAVDSSSTECVASIAVFDNRITSPRVLPDKSGVACIQVFDGTPEVCKSLGWDSTRLKWLTELRVNHGGHGCRMSALSFIGAADPRCALPRAATAFITDTRP